MAKEKIKREYAELIAEKKDKWEESLPEWKEQWFNNIDISVEAYVVLWDTLKEIEKKYNIDLRNIATEMRYKGGYASGVGLAKNYKEHGLKELYLAYLSTYEVVCAYKWFEFNDEVLSLWCQSCPCIQSFRKLGRTEEEIKEMGPLFCLADYALMMGFNPELDIFPQPRLIMRGDSHCSYRAEDRRVEKHKKVTTTEEFAPKINLKISF